jgi:MYXO-CTERM domain-containing protein
MIWIRSLSSLAVIALALVQASDAAACGCFANPSPATPVVQAGERILFAHDGDQVIAYIQIKYQGAADQFGWIVPLPSVPTLELGTDELFDSVDRLTTPQYLLTNTRQFCGGGSSSSSSSSLGCGGPFAASSGGGANAGAVDAGIAGTSDLGAPSIVVTQASLGPYDYAVLKADDKTALLDWLDANRYFVPAGTTDVMAPYVHKGAYFLALKLRGGESTGDIAPIVLRYSSDLPMIPITLTQVGAVPNMGILVWVLGEARAIPRNYYSVVLDDLPVWLSNFADYNRALIAAVKEAPGKHGFITQYAGNAVNPLLASQLDYSGRFGNLAVLRTEATPAGYLEYLRSHGYAFDGTMLSILSRFIPEPQLLRDSGVPLSQFYQQYEYYADQVTDPDGGAPPAFDAAAATDEISARVVTPIKAAAALFQQHRYLTRLYTAMSPIDMNLDPVFSSNRDLPEVPLLHSATLTTPCTGEPWLSTDGGFEAQYPGGLPPSRVLPAALRVELVRDAGQPELVQDNREVIATALGPVSHGSMSSGGSGGGSGHDGGCGCSVGGMQAAGTPALLLGLCAVALVLRRRRRHR